VRPRLERAYAATARAFARLALELTRVAKTDRVCALVEPDRAGASAARFGRSTKVRAATRVGCGDRMRARVWTALATATTIGFDAGGMICGEPGNNGALARRSAGNGTSAGATARPPAKTARGTTLAKRRF